MADENTGQPAFNRYKVNDRSLGLLERSTPGRVRVGLRNRSRIAAMAALSGGAPCGAPVCGVFRPAISDLRSCHLHRAGPEQEVPSGRGVDDYWTLVTSLPRLPNPHQAPRIPSLARRDRD